MKYKYMLCINIWPQEVLEINMTITDLYWQNVSAECGHSRE